MKNKKENFLALLATLAFLAQKIRVPRIGPHFTKTLPPCLRASVVIKEFRHKKGAIA